MNYIEQEKEWFRHHHTFVEHTGDFKLCEDWNIKTSNLTLDMYMKNSREVMIPVPRDGKWHHVSIIRNHHNVMVYVDAKCPFNSNKIRPRKVAMRMKKGLLKKFGMV